MAKQYKLYEGVIKVKSGFTRGLYALAAAITATVLAAVIPLSASADSSYWHVGYYTPSPHGTLSEAQATAVSGGVASLNFTDQPNTALLATDQKAKYGSLLGDQTAKTITANYTISGATGAFTYYGEGTPSNPCGTPANVRLYFETSNAGGFNPANYWWANPNSQLLNNGNYSLSANVEPAEWSDYNGQPGTLVPTQFAAAASHITKIGVSFGGGCFFENGVGTTDGSGTFTLNSYSSE